MFSKKSAVILGVSLLTLSTPSIAHATEAEQYAPGDAVPTTIDPDGFIPKTPNKGISFYDSSSPAPSCVDVQPAEGIVKLKKQLPE